MPRGGGGGRGGGRGGGGGGGRGGGRGGWGGRGGHWGHGGWGRRGYYGGYGGGGWGYSYPYYAYDYPTTYYVETEKSPEYNDCIYAAGKCPDNLKKEFGDSIVRNPSDRCEEQRVQDFVKKLPAKCRPERYTPQDEEWVGVL